MSTSAKLEQIIERVGDLPAMPKAVSRALALTDDPDVDLSEVADAIQTDPALSAKILRISNSPYYGMRQYVGTLKLALVVLGVREIRNIVLGVAVFDALHTRKTESMLAGDFWKHSFEVAAFSKKFGEHLKLTVHGEDFVTGLLHDIGKLVLMRQFETEYSTIYAEAGGWGETLCAAEDAAFGFTHADAAAALATYWNFTRTLVDGLLLHHPNTAVPLRDAIDPVLAAVVRLSNRAAREGNRGGGSGDPAPAGDPEAWDIISGRIPELDEPARAGLLAKFADAIASVPVPRL